MKSVFISLVTIVGWMNEKIAQSFSPQSKRCCLPSNYRRKIMISGCCWPAHHSKSLATLARDTVEDPHQNQWAQSIYQQKSRQLAAATTLSLAPMMEYTDKHFRHLTRLISSNTLLYTEMVTANAIVQQKQKHTSTDDSSDSVTSDMSYLQRLLGQSSVKPLEGPSVLQLGGSDPKILEKATAIVLEHSMFRDTDTTSGSQQFQSTQQSTMQQSTRFCDYTAINLNCGCPSPKVAGSGCFGAALMQQPHLVKDCVLAMAQGCKSMLPITVKCRIGTDEHVPFQRGYVESLESKKVTFEKLYNFIDVVSSSGVVSDFQIHARIAVLDKSFSPVDNRNIPPLQYDIVYNLVREFPHLKFSLNG